MLISSLLTAAILASPQDDAARKLSAALSKTAETGGIRFKGRSSNSGGADPILSQLGSLGMGFFEGTFGATVDPAGFRRIDIDSSRGRTEIYERDGRIVKKQVWQGDMLNVDGFADEIVQLLNLKRIAEHAAKSPLAAVEKASGGRKVLEVTGTLPVSLIQERGEPGNMMRAYTRFQVDELKLKAEIDLASGLLHRIEFTLGKSNAMMDLIRRQLGQEEREGSDLVLSYSFEVEAVEAGLKPEVPADVLKRFEE